MSNSLDLTIFVQYGLNAADKHMLARKAAAARYNTVRSQALRSRIWNRLTGHASRLQTLTNSHSLPKQKTFGVVNVPLASIIGTEGRSEDFDAEFRPLKTHNQDRWIGVAAARFSGVVLPPVELIQAGDQYFVRDGHHRTSVAKALGQIEIEARIVN